MTIPAHVDPGMILRAVAAVGEVEPQEITGQGRTHEIIVLRWATWRIMRRRGWSMPKIGFHTRHDHTSVLHGLRTLAHEIAKATPRGRRALWIESQVHELLGSGGPIPPEAPPAMARIVMPSTADLAPGRDAMAVPISARLGGHRMVTMAGYVNKSGEIICWRPDGV